MVMVMMDIIMEKINYDRGFLLQLQFINVSMIKPEGLPVITDVILDRVSSRKPLGKPNTSRHLPGGMDRGSDLRPSAGETGWRDRPRRHFSLSVDVQLNKAKEAWKPSGKKQQRREEVDDTEEAKTQDLFNRVRGILNKLTLQKFQQLTKQVTELTIDTEGRLKGVMDIIFEKAISEPSFSVVYAKMCQYLMELNVPSADKPGVCVNFRRLLLNRCKTEFDKKQKELDAAQGGEKQLCKEELDHYKNKARRCSLGNIKFIGELFKLKMMTAATMDKCIINKLLITHDEESLECLCTLVSTIGKDMDFEMAKPCMGQMEKIVKERKTSPRIRFMLQDVLDLQQNKWVPRRGDQGPKTIEQIHKDAEMEVQMEQLKVQQTLISNESIRGSGDRLGGGQGRPGGWSSYTPRQGRVAKGWNSYSSSTNNQPIDTSRLSKMTKTRVLDINNQLLAPGNKGYKGSSVGISVKPADSGSELGIRPATSTLNRLSDLQQPSSGSSLHSDRLLAQDSPSRVHARSTTENMKQEAAINTPPPQTPTITKSAWTEEEVEKKSTAIIEEYLHINDMKEALQCVQELNSGQLLFVFVRNGLESTLDRSTIVRDHMGQLLHQLVKAGIMPIQQYYKGLQVILDVAEDMSTDIPHFWLYLAELIAPMVGEGGIPMGQLFKEISKTLIPLGMAGNLLLRILILHCKAMSQAKLGDMWREAGLSWKDFLPEDTNVNTFVSDNDAHNLLVNIN